MGIAALAALIAGLAIVIAYARLRRLGRDPLGSRPDRDLPDTALALALGVVAWLVAQFLVVGAFADAHDVGPLSGRTVQTVVFMATQVVIALALLRPALRGTTSSRLSVGRVLAAGAAGAVVLFAGELVYSEVVTAAYKWAGAKPPVQAIVEEVRAARGADLAVYVVCSIALAPFAEEVFFRGILLPAVARSVGPARGLVLQALAFGLIHCLKQWDAWPNAMALAGVGWLAGWLYLRTGSLAVPIVMHASFNAANLVTLLMSERPAAS